MTPPSALCLVCRVVLPSGERCDLDPRHPTAQLDVDSGRERALAAVWGPPSARQQARQLARAGASGGIAGGMAEVFAHGCSGCGEFAGAGELGAVFAVFAAIVAVALSAVLVVWLVGRGVTAWQRRKHRLRPLGAPRALADRMGTSFEGVVRAKELTDSWTGERPCVAWGVEALAEEHRGGAVMLRDGRSAAFTLALDDGRTIEVPAGRARVWAQGEAPDAAREQARGEALRVQLGAIAEGADEYDVVVPADRADAVLIGPGDRVRIIAALEPLPSAEDGYRDHQRAFRVVGVPRIARVG